MTYLLPGMTYNLPGSIIIIRFGAFMKALLRKSSEYLLFPPVRASGDALSRALQHKVILITGASYGIGETLVYLLADCDAHLILVARSGEKLAAIKDRLANRRARISIHTVDLADEAQLNALIACLGEEAPRIDILVNNAGKSICRPIMASLDRFHDFQRTMRLNYMASVRLCLALIPVLSKNRGQIVNVSAVNVLLAPAPLWAAYQASKCAFDQWLRSASAELSLEGIAVSTAYLPLVRTRMIAPTAAYRNVPAMSPEQAATRLCRLMLNRKSRYRPWWLPFGQLGSVLFDNLWLKLSIRYLRRKSRNDQGT